MVHVWFPYAGSGHKESKPESETKPAKGRGKAAEKPPEAKEEEAPPTKKTGGKGSATKAKVSWEYCGYVYTVTHEHVALKPTCIFLF